MITENHERINVLFIHHAVGWGGAPINMINIINSLDKTQFSVHVLLLKDSIVSEKLSEYKIPYTIARSKFYKKFYKYLGHSEAGYIRWYQILKFFKLAITWLLSNRIYARKELDQFEPDIIHLNSSVLTDWLKPSSKKGKVIIHVQEPFRRGRLDFLYYLLRYQIKQYADHIIAISKDNAKRIDIPQKTTVVYNFTKIHHHLSPSDINFERHRKILYLGGAASIKGFYTLVNALGFIDDNILILFAGHYPPNTAKSGFRKHLPWNKKLQKALITMRNSSNAIEVGLIEDTGSIIIDCDLLVSPFRIEHFSRPIIEAFACKKAVIGTDVEGMDEIIDHNINGLIIKKNNPRELADAINFLSKNHEIASTFGEKGYIKATMHFSEKNTKQIERIYEKLCKKK